MTDPVQEVVTDSSIEASLAAAFERTEPKAEPRQAREPVEQEEEEESPVQAEAEESAEEPAEAEPAAEDEFEDYEIGGKAYRIPKELKDPLERDKNYTQKMQDVAETRRVYEERAQALAIQEQFQKQNFEKSVEVHSIETKLQQYANIDWPKLAAEDPAQCVQLNVQYQALEREYNRVKQEMQGMQGEFIQKMDAAKQQAQANCINELKRHFTVDVPTLTALDETGRGYGFSPQELAQIVDPRMIRVLHAAMQWKKLQGSKSVVEKKVATAKPVQVQAARTSVSNQQSAQIKDMKNRAMKSGRPSDMEAFLAQRFAKPSR